MKKCLQKPTARSNPTKTAFFNEPPQPVTKVEIAADCIKGGEQNRAFQKPQQIVPRKPSKIVLKKKRSFAQEVKSLIKAIIGKL